MLELDPYRALPNPGETALIEVRPEVAVIGAGVSGLIAARILAEHGYPVSILDKALRPGGRSSTRREGEFAFDHGCQYFTARDRRFQRYVEAWTELGIVSPWKARRAACGRGQSTAVEDDVMRYVGVPGMNAVTRHLAKELDVRSGVTVSGFVRHRHGWRLLASLDIPETYEIVVISTPAPQAAALVGGASPVGQEAASVSMHPCWTAMAAFGDDLEAPFDAAHFSGSALVWAANNSRKPGRAAQECWVLQASPSWTSDHLEEPPDHVARQLLAAFFEDAGLPPAVPLFTGAHRWRYASPANPLDRGYLWDPENGIGLCGDWCHSARMEGAFLSGLELAEKIMDDRPRANLDR